MHALTGHVPVYKRLTYGFYDSHVPLQIITLSEADKESSNKAQIKQL